MTSENPSKINWRKKSVLSNIISDESTDVMGTAQVAIFVRGIGSEFKITEEMASLVPLKGTTKARNLFQSVETTLNKFSLNLVNISGLAIRTVLLLSTP